MIRNYFLLIREYKRITHTKKVEEGDWILVKKRSQILKKQDRFQMTTIFVGKVESLTRSNSVDIRVEPFDVWTVSHDGDIKQSLVGKGSANTLRVRVKDSNIDAYLWNPECRTFPEYQRPHLNETVIYHVFALFR